MGEGEVYRDYFEANKPIKLMVITKSNTCIAYWRKGGIGFDVEDEELDKIEYMRSLLENQGAGLLVENVDF